MTVTYQFDISLSEGIAPSEISDLQSMISKFANDQLFKNINVKSDFMYMFSADDITKHIKLNISKYFDKYYMIEIDNSTPGLYEFINLFVYKIYENKVVNKYILHVKDDGYIPELWYPIGNLDLPSSFIYHKIYTMNWIVYPLLVQISLSKDYEILDTLLGNMNPKYFEKMKDAYYDEIMNLSNNIEYGIPINANVDEDFKIRFIHWCNYYASMNEDEDNDIML